MKYLKKNIIFTNNNYKKVNKRIRNIKGIKDKYILNEKIIYRKYIKTKGKKFNVNIKYKISDIKNNDFIFENVATGKRQGIVRKLLQKYFIYAYCYTTHSKQGCSVDDDIIGIFFG